MQIKSGELAPDQDNEGVYRICESIVGKGKEGCKMLDRALWITVWILQAVLIAVDLAAYKTIRGTIFVAPLLILIKFALDQEEEEMEDEVQEFETESVYEKTRYCAFKKSA